MAGKRKIKPSVKARASSPPPPSKKRGRPAASVSVVTEQGFKEGLADAAPASGSVSARETRLNETLQARERVLMDKESQLSAAMVVLASVETQLRELQDALQCQVCMESQKEVTFECGHMACKTCGVKVKQCPWCGIKIRKRLSLFF